MLHLPRIDKKLASVAALTARGVLVPFKHNQAVLMSENVTVARIKRLVKMFAWDVKQQVSLDAHKAEQYCDK